MSMPHILVFDSGVGGLSIVQHLRSQLPGARLSYLADNARFPYGLLDDNTLVTRCCELLTAAGQRLAPDIIVVACNSASTLALPALRERIDTPIIGVVPAIKPAAELSASRVIGLLATPGTVNRPYTLELINEFAGDCRVLRVGSASLVNQVERFIQGEAISAAVIEEVAGAFREQAGAAAMDTLVLACTHFPLVQDQLAAALPQVRHWVDSGAAIARRAIQLLGPATNTHAPATDHRAWLTAPPIQPGPAAECFQRYGFSQLTLW